MALVSGDMFIADIRFPGEGVKRQWGCRQRQFSAFSLTISSETLQTRSTLLHNPRTARLFCKHLMLREGGGIHPPPSSQLGM